MHNFSKGIWDYHQPDFYRFSQDSLELAKTAYAAISKKISNQSGLKILDLCCGCGVVGFELANLLSGYLLELDFCEAQPEFYPFIEANVQAYLKIQPEQQLKYCLIEQDISRCLQAKIVSQRYDIIVANPPYYLLGSGKGAQDPHRNQCRFWSEQQRTEFFQMIAHALKAEGTAFVCLKSFWRQTDQVYLGEIGLNIVEQKKLHDLKILALAKTV